MIVFENKSTKIEARKTPWDDRVFGFPCAEIVSLEGVKTTSDVEVLLSFFDNWVREEGIQFAYGRFAPTQINKQAFHKSGFYFAEASYRIRQTKIASCNDFDCLIRNGPQLVLAKEEDYEYIQDILANDFHHGRIHEDPWVEEYTASRRYKLWLNDLVAQKQEIYSYKLNGQIIGLHIQRCNEYDVDLVLTGVKKSHALLGASLWAEVLKLNRLRGIRIAHTLVSASNIPVLNLYRRLDFQFDSLLLGFHKKYTYGKACPD